MGERLREYWRYYGQFTQTRTRDTSEYGYWNISGLLKMESKRTMTNIARQTAVSSQSRQHYMSESPWSGAELIGSIRESISQWGEFQAESVLVLDESADEKAGDNSAGAGRQHNGRLGKCVDHLDNRTRSC